MEIQDLNLLIDMNSVQIYYDFRAKLSPTSSIKLCIFLCTLYGVGVSGLFRLLVWHPNPVTPLTSLRGMISFPPSPGTRSSL